MTANSVPGNLPTTLLNLKMIPYGAGSGVIAYAKFHSSVYKYSVASDTWSALPDVYIDEDAYDYAALLVPLDSFPGCGRGV